MSRMPTSAQRAVLIAASEDGVARFAGSGATTRSCVAQGWLDQQGRLTDEGRAVLEGTGGLKLSRVKVTINLTPDQAGKLQDHAQRAGVSRSALLRRMVDALPDLD